MIKRCPECRAEFRTRKSEQKYCGNDCRYQAARHTPNPGTYKPGRANERNVPVGTVRIRVRQRDGRSRAWIKIRQTNHPSDWIPFAQHVWEQVHGPIPIGLVLHHQNRDPLDDRLENLQLLTRAEHLREHRAEFEERRLEGLRKATVEKAS